MIDEFFYGLEKINKNDKKINLRYVQFDAKNFVNTDRSQMKKTAQDFFHTLFEFAKVHNRKLVNVYMVDDCLQDLKSDTCEYFNCTFTRTCFCLNRIVKY